MFSFELVLLIILNTKYSVSKLLATAHLHPLPMQVSAHSAAHSAQVHCSPLPLCVAAAGAHAAAEGGVKKASPAFLLLLLLLLLSAQERGRLAR